MAAIDKIYVNSCKEYKEFEEWLLKQPKLKDKYGKEVSIYSYFFTWWDDPEYWNRSRPIFSAPYYVDAYIIRKCPLDYIQKSLMLNYGHKTCPSLKSIKRRILKWKLPVGTIITLSGRYVGETYKIIVKR